MKKLILFAMFAVVLSAQQQTYTPGGGGGGSSTTPVTTVAASGSAQTLTFASNGDTAYDITLSANFTFSITSPTSNSTFRRIILVIHPAGFTATLPPSSSTLAWAGGSAPSPSISAITELNIGFGVGTVVLGGI